MKPVLLDLFCGAGGCTKGYQEAGFCVIGVDINPQPNYCGDEFYQADALKWLEGWMRAAPLQFSAIHASPPCQAYSATSSLHNNDHPELVEPVRELLVATGLPYVMENVVGAPLLHPFVLCGSSFGLGVRRHRLFETNWPIGMVPPCSHHEYRDPIDVTGLGGPGGRHRKPNNLAHAREVMGIDWMTRKELSQAIPPAYTRFIGEQLMEIIK